jgi:hypothetical protein
MAKKPLFNDNFPENIQTNEELKNLKDKYPDYYDPYYVTTGAIKERREKVEKIWNIYKPYANNHFLSEYKRNKNFNSRTWEMYVGAALITNNLKIKTSKDDSWPDFIINESIYLECTACRNASSPNKPDYIPTVEYGKVANVPIDQIIMRITSAIRDKHCDYIKHFKKDDIDSRTPFILAINSGAFRHNQSGIFPIIYKVLFGIHHPVLHLRREGTSVEGVGFDISTREQVYKYKDKKKAPIDLNIFLNDKYKEISAIVFCSNNIINAPEKLGDDCLFIPNPHAKNSIDPKIFSFFKQPEDVKSIIDVRRFI